MNIFDLIEPINLINQIKTDALSKQRNSLNVSITRKKPGYSFMSSRMHSRPYNDSFINTAVSPQTRKNSNGPVNKSLASKTRIDIMVPDLNRLTTETERYKFVTTASRDVLAKIEPSMYFGIRVGPVYKPIDMQLIYDFDSNVIYKREFAEDESRIVYNENSPYMMIDKVNYRNIFIDTKNFVPILSYQMTRMSEIETYEDDNITEDLVPNGFFSEHPNADNIREEARMHEEEKQFNQGMQELREKAMALESEAHSNEVEESRGTHYSVKTNVPLNLRPNNVVEPVVTVESVEPVDTVDTVDTVDNDEEILSEKDKEVLKYGSQNQIYERVLYIVHDYLVSYVNYLNSKNGSDKTIEDAIKITMSGVKKADALGRNHSLMNLVSYCLEQKPNSPKYKLGKILQPFAEIKDFDLKHIMNNCKDISTINYPKKPVTGWRY